MGQSITLITGATGFLGKHLVEQLKAGSAACLRLLCRGATPWAGDPRVEVVRGDIALAEDVARAMEGCGEVYHLAGVVSRNPNDQALLYKVHVEGTRNVCEAAQRHRVRKIVLVSSSGTIAVSREPVPHDENSGYKHELVGQWPYYLSKVFAEKLALDYFRCGALPVVIVNPSLLLGPGDDRYSSTHDIALFLRGQIMTVPAGGLNFVDARDAAAGLIAAMLHGRPGERYLLAGPNWTFGELIARLSEISGVRAPRVRLPLGAALLGARVLRRLYPLTGKRYEVDEESIRMSALFWYCDAAKARAELGFRTRDPLETLRDTVADLRSRGW